MTNSFQIGPSVMGWFYRWSEGTASSLSWTDRRQFGGSCGAEAPNGFAQTIGRSPCKFPAWRDRLDDQARTRNLDPEPVSRETDPSDLMERLYVKVDEEGDVKARYKYVRADFLTVVRDSGTHWLRRPIVPNLLASGS